jgi:hypothetical protein
MKGEADALAGTTLCRCSSYSSYVESMPDVKSIVAELLAVAEASSTRPCGTVTLRMPAFKVRLLSTEISSGVPVPAVVRPNSRAVACVRKLAVMGSADGVGAVRLMVQSVNVPDPAVQPVATVTLIAPVPVVYAEMIPAIHVVVGADVRAMMTGCPGAQFLPVCVVNDLDPVPIVRLVVLVPPEPGAFTAVFAAVDAVAAFVVAVRPTSCRYRSSC